MFLMLCCCERGMLSSSLLRRSCVAPLPCRCSTDCLLLRRERTEREREREMMRETERERLYCLTACVWLDSFTDELHGAQKREGGEGGERRERGREEGGQRGWRADCCWQPGQSKYGWGNMGVAWGQWRPCRAGQIYNVSLSSSLRLSISVVTNLFRAKIIRNIWIKSQRERCSHAEWCLSLYFLDAEYLTRHVRTVKNEGP